MCLPFNLTFMSLLLISFHSIRHFSRPFLKMMTSLLWCWSSAPEYSTVSPVLDLCLPKPAHLLTLIPRKCRFVTSHVSFELYRLSFLVDSFYIPESNSRLPFGAQNFHLPVSSFLWAFTTVIHTRSLDDSENPSCPVVLIFFVTVFFFFVSVWIFSPVPSPLSDRWVALPFDLSSWGCPTRRQSSSGLWGT